MDDYYSLMGVEPDAPVDEIRAAYRDKKAAIVGATDADKVTAKKLNKAWNVLSDPYQRGRYDEQLSQATENGEVVEADDEAPSTNGRRPAPAARGSRQPRAPLQPTLELPAGMRLAPRRNRIIAMVIDLAVIAIVFIGCTQFGTAAIAKSQKPEVVDQIDAYTKQIDAQTKIKNDAHKQVKDGKVKCSDPAASQPRKDECAADKQIKDLKDKRLKENAKLNGIFFAMLAVSSLFALLYLILPSLRSGKTLGKRIQHIKVVAQDGSPATPWSLVSRYGPLVLIATAFMLTPLSIIGVAIVLLVVTRWMSNANQQGMHDRFAKTIVIEDGGAA